MVYALGSRANQHTRTKLKSDEKKRNFARKQVKNVCAIVQLKKQKHQKPGKELCGQLKQRNCNVCAILYFIRNGNRNIKNIMMFYNNMVDVHWLRHVLVRMQYQKPCSRYLPFLRLHWCSQSRFYVVFQENDSHHLLVLFRERCKKTEIKTNKC